LSAIISEFFKILMMVEYDGGREVNIQAIIDNLSVRRFVGMELFKGLSPQLLKLSASRRTVWDGAAEQAAHPVAKTFDKAKTTLPNPFCQS
jgi:hypothetical protein